MPVHGIVSPQSLAPRSQASFPLRGAQHRLERLLHAIRCQAFEALKVSKRTAARKAETAREMQRKGDRARIKRRGVLGVR